jgi:hypothetical protein
MADNPFEKVAAEGFAAYHLRFQEWTAAPEVDRQLWIMAAEQVVRRADVHRPGKTLFEAVNPGERWDQLSTSAAVRWTKAALCLIRSAL